MNESQLAPATKKSGMRSWRFWVGALLSLACLVWLVVTTDWAQTGRALAQANYWLVATAVLLNLLTIPMRTLRWQLLFPPPQPAVGPLTVAMLIGQAVNVVAPARLGDLVRASLIEEHPTAYVLGTQMVQSALDLLMTAVLVIILLFQVTLPDWWRGSGEALLLTAGVALVVIVLMVLVRHPVTRLLQAIPRRWPRLPGRRLLHLGVQFLRSLDTFERPLALVWALAWSVGIWVVYGLTNYVLLAAVWPQPSLLAAFFVLVVLQLSIAVPSSPGRIGVYHYLGVQALAVFAVSNAAAVSFAIILHLISVILPIIIGALLAWQRGIALLPSRSQVEA